MSSKEILEDQAIAERVILRCERCSRTVARAEAVLNAMAHAPQFSGRPIAPQGESGEGQGSPGGPGTAAPDNRSRKLLEEAI